MRVRRIFGVAGLVAGGAALIATPARAGNGLHPRTPVEWNDVTCVELVDRSTDPIFMLDYDIPYEDTEVTPEEVDDSRTHQFFAMCRQNPPQEFLPGWISQADVDAAAINYPGDTDSVTPQDVLESSLAWQNCYVKITPDDERRPITDAMASMPVPWDTTTAPAGVYFIWGFTHEPVFNLWTPRIGGFVRVYDGGDPTADGPAGAITTREQTPCVGEVVPIDGCVHAAAGTTMTGYWALTNTPGAQEPGWEPDWIMFAEGLPVEGESFTIDWEAPEAASGESVMIRVDFTDPGGTTYTAYEYELNIVLPRGTPGCAADPDDCMGGFIMDPACETTGAATDTGDATGTGGTDTGATTATGTDASSTTAGGSGDDGGGGGGDCGCRSSAPAPAWSYGLLLLGLATLRRRRR
jgi:MYXO-CTERM domain-containing protein